MVPDQRQAWDDVSDYDGTKCSADQVYDASTGTCDPDTVTDNAGTDDDISNYDNVTCSPDQVYDASTGQCTTAAVTTDGQPPVQPGVLGISDPGHQCAETQTYSVPDGRCMPDLVTNDPDAVVNPEGEDPTAYIPMKVDDIPECASGDDPLHMCAGGPAPTVSPAPAATVAATADPQPDSTIAVVAPAAPTATPG